MRQARLMLEQYVYASRSLYPSGHISDLDILRSAIAKNEAGAISGYLLRTQTMFCQVLEAETDRLDSLIAVLSKDVRHSEMRQLARRPIDVRNFGKWSMGFTMLKPPDRDRLQELIANAPCPAEDCIDFIHQAIWH